MVSFPSVKVRTAGKEKPDKCLFGEKEGTDQNRKQLQEHSCVDAVWTRTRRIAGICPGPAVCLLTFALLSVFHVNKDHICSARLGWSLLYYL